MSLALPDQIKSELKHLLVALQSTDNELRKQAETTLDSIWTKQRLRELLVGLIEQSLTNEDVTNRSYSAILFRRIAFKLSANGEDNMHWDELDEPTQSLIQTSLIQGLVREKVDPVRHQISNVITELANNSSIDGEELNRKWPNLMPSLFHIIQESEDCAESVYRVLSGIFMIIPNDKVADVRQVLVYGLKTNSLKLQCAAFKACSELLIVQKSLCQADCALIPEMLVIMPNIHKVLDDELIDCLNSLAELVMTHSKPFKQYFSDISKFCFLILGQSDNNSLKQAALELVVTFCEGLPAYVRSQQQIVSQLVINCLKMMTELVPEGCDETEELQEWLENDDSDSEEQDLNRLVAEQALDRIARKLGGNAIIPPAFTGLPSMIASSDWKQRHAALMAISSIAEGCEKLMKKELKLVLDLVLPALKDSHPRVRWAAANAVGQMSTDFADEIQQKFGNQILPALIQTLTSPEPRVQSHAAAACVNFAEEADHLILEPHLNSLLTNLFHLLQSPKKYVQEQAVTTIATVADAAEHKFIAFYDTIMPLLMNVLRQDSAAEFRLLRGKTIECATLIALAVGKEKFAPHRQEMIEILANIQSSLTDSDDPQASYLIIAWGRICRILGKEFLPYLGAVMPPLLEMARAQPDFTILDSEEDNEKEMEEEGWNFIPLHGHQVGIKTSVLEDKCSASEMLIRYAAELQELFEPYVETVLTDIVLPGLKFYLDDGVRIASAKSIPVLLNCEKKAHPENSQLSLTIFKQILQKLIDAINVEPSVDIVAEFFQAIYESVEVLGLQAVTDDEVINITLVPLESQLKAVKERLENRDAEAAAGEIDLNDDVDDELMEAIDADERILSEINKTLHVFFKHKKQGFVSHWEKFLPYYQKFFNTGKETLIQWALCGVVDVIEFASPDSWRYKDLFLHPLTASLTSEQPSLKQAGAYGVGIAAQFGGELYTELYMKALPILFGYFQLPDCRSEENEYATEAACVAISRILHYQASKFDPTQRDQYIRMWLHTLPCTVDDSEASYPYLFLIELMKERHQAIADNLESVFKAVVAVLKADILQGNLVEKLVYETKELLSLCPYEKQQKLVMSIQPENRGIVEKYFH